jgi:hypothetical protein
MTSIPAWFSDPVKYCGLTLDIIFHFRVPFLACLSNDEVEPSIKGKTLFQWRHCILFPPSLTEKDQALQRRTTPLVQIRKTQADDSFALWYDEGEGGDQWVRVEV